MASRLGRSRPTGIGGFRFERVIGDGANGRVYAATDHGERIAVKVAHAELALSPATRDRFEREFEAARRIDSPHVVRVRRSGAVRGRPWIAMELVDGRSLRELMYALGPLSVGDTARIGRAVALALQAAHAVHVLHRDIKPANVLVDRRGTIRVVDFGVAHFEASVALTPAGGLSGSPLYAAPETYLGSPSAASDVYSLGAMLYELLTGTPPFEGSSPLELLHTKVDPPVDLLTMRTDVPRPLANLVGQMIAADPGARPAAGTIASELARWAGGQDHIDATLVAAVPPCEVDLVRTHPGGGGFLLGAITATLGVAGLLLAAVALTRPSASATPSWRSPHGRAASREAPPEQQWMRMSEH